MERAVLQPLLLQLSFERRRGWPKAGTKQKVYVWGEVGRWWIYFLLDGSAHACVHVHNTLIRFNIFLYIKVIKVIKATFVRIVSINPTAMWGYFSVRLETQF